MKNKPDSIAAASSATKKSAAAHVAIEAIASRILILRGQRAILDADLAALYGVQTRVLNQAVKRNAERFPADFMFQLSARELEDWRSQAVISNPGARRGLRRAPFVFTEHGALMAASLLNSPRTRAQAPQNRLRARRRMIRKAPKNPNRQIPATSRPKPPRRHSAATSMRFSPKPHDPRRHPRAAHRTRHPGPSRAQGTP